METTICTMECRLCLRSAPAEYFVPIHDNSHLLTRHIWTCCQLQVEQDDELPDTICLSCVDNLKSFINFRNVCFQSVETANNKLRLHESFSVKTEEVNLEDTVWENESKASTNHINNENSTMFGSLTVTEIQKIDFSQLALEEKIYIKEKGRPTPEIRISQPGISNNKKYVRSFNSSWYTRVNWLCGCEVRNSLFCFPCLLMGGDSIWTKNGCKNINKIKDKTEKHAHTVKHINNVLSLSLLSNICNKEHLSEAYKLSIVGVKKNREILSKIINCLIFCISSKISLCGHDETEESDNSSIFKNLLNFSANLDSDLKHHLSTNPVFKKTSKIIQNELLDSMLMVCREQIALEIEKSSYLTIIVDDTTDVSEQIHLALVLRYELNGEIFERFWGFFTLENKKGSELSMIILDQLNILLKNDKSKLIAQIYNGVVTGETESVQSKVKEVYKNAHFIHYYAHHPDLIMKNAANITISSKIFFSNLLSIPRFFSKSPHRLCIVKKYINIDISRSGWNFHVGTICKVYENKTNLIRCFKELQTTSTTEKNICESTAMLEMLENKDFLFWLELFHQIMPHVESLCNQMQSISIDLCKIEEYIKHFNDAVEKIRDSELIESLSAAQMLEAKKVCDFICNDMKNRCTFLSHLVIGKLFNKEQFGSFSEKLPSGHVKDLVKVYPMLDEDKLLVEFRVFYSRTEMQEFNSLTSLLNFIYENNLSEIFCELSKLIKIAITIPMTAAEPERCSSTLNRIKTFLRSKLNEDRLTALGMISMEKAITNMSNFNERVIDLFSKGKNRRIEFIFK